MADDGCTASVTIDPGFACTGEPSVYDDNVGCCSTGAGGRDASALALLVLGLVGRRRRRGTQAGS